MPQKIKQILVFSPLYPPHVGGLESHAAQWNEEMSKRGYQITVWTPRVPAGGALEEVSSTSVRVMRYPAFEIVSNYPLPNIFHPILWKQLRAVKRVEADLIVSRTRFFFSSFLALIFARLQGAPLFHIEHGSDFVHLHNPLLRTLARLYDYTLGRLVLRSANKVVANSKASATFVSHLSHRTADAVIYRGIDLSKIRSIPSVSDSPPTTIAYVGRLIDGKGVHDLIDALGRLTDISWKCWIIGDGPQRPSLSAQVERVDTGKAISFLGELSWADTIAHLKASTVVVNPSYTEGMPTTIIEAAAAGIPVVATDVGGTGEVITDSRQGVLVPVGDTYALAEAIRQVCTDPKYRQPLSRAAEDAVAKKFTWSSAADAYERIFTSLEKAS